MSQFLRHYLLAVQFFTRLPLGPRLAAWVGFSPAMLRASAAHFPGVGVLLGLLLVGVYTLLIHGLPRNSFSPLVAAVGMTVAGVALTGALHEDGLADVADGLGASPERERALLIMKDSRLGSYGVLALVLALLAKLSLLALLGAQQPGLLCSALFVAQVFSRLWPLQLIRALPYVGDVARSKSRPLAAQISTRSLRIAWLWCALALGGLLGLQTLAPGMQAKAPTTAAAVAAGLAASALVYLWLRRWFARRLQGLTGDCLGACQQLCEIAFYLGYALVI